MIKFLQRGVMIGVFLILLTPHMTLSAATETKVSLQTNLLQNPGFEFPYNDDGAAGNWVRWHRNSSEDAFSDCLNGYHKRPHWSAETATAALIHSGSASQHIGNQWDTWQAGVWQNVTVTPGTTYRFTVHARAFASSEDFPAPSDGGMQSNVRVGIDPNGSGLWNDVDVIWSAPINPLDVWQSVSVEGVAAGNTITVFTSGNYGIQGVNQCRKHLDVWFDTAEVIEVGPPPTNTPPPVPTNPPPPPATSTPSPIPPTATSDVPPTETPVPPTDTPVPPTGGIVCVNAFADNNANGVRDDTEGYMGSVTFTVANGSNVVGQALSTGTDSPYCFEGLEPGVYQIAQLVPGRLEMTTAGNATIEVTEGSTVGVEFGSRIRPEGEEVANVPDSTPVANDNSAAPAAAGGLGNIAGLLVLIAGVVLIGILLFFLLRRQTE